MSLPTPEGSMFSSAADKRRLPEFAQRHGARLVPVSYGRTGDTATINGWAAVKPLTHLNDDVGQRLVDGMSDDEARKTYTDRLVEHFRKPRVAHRQRGLPTIDIVYINLKAPTGQFADLGGIALLEAALEGGRLTLTQPEQLDALSEVLEAQPLEPAIASLLPGLARTTQAYLADYGRLIQAQPQASTRS